MKKRVALSQMRNFCLSTFAMGLIFFAENVFAQNLTQTIKDTIDKGATLLILILVGAAAWAGFELKSGNPQAVSKLIYCIVAIVIVGSANAIVSFFKV